MSPFPRNQWQEHWSQGGSWAGQPRSAGSLMDGWTWKAERCPPKAPPIRKTLLYTGRVKRGRWAPLSLRLRAAWER